MWRRRASEAANALSPSTRATTLVVAAALFLQLLDTTIVTTSLPQIAAAFGVTPTDMAIGLTIYLLGMAMFIPAAGWTSDRFGARRVFLASTLIFILSSLWIGLSRSLEEFVIARFLQGAGSAMMTPVGRIIVMRVAAKKELLQAINVLASPALAAPVIGPFVGGLVTVYLSWRWNFFLNVPIGLVIVVMALRLFPSDTEFRAGRLDLRGFVLTAAALTTLLFGLELLAQLDADLACVLPVIVVGMALGVLSVHHLRKVAEPLIDLTPCRRLSFRVSTATGGILFRIAVSATPFLLPLMFQVSFGLGPVEAGTYLLIYFLGNWAMKAVTTAIIRRFGFRRVLFWNGALCALSQFALALLTPELPFAAIAVVLAAGGLVRSLQFTALNSLGLADISRAERGAASVLSTMAQQLAMVLGVALAACLLNLLQTATGLPHLTLNDFHLVFCVMGLVCLLALTEIWRLPTDAGDSITRRGAE